MASETRCSVMTSLDAGAVLALGRMLKMMDQSSCMSAETLSLLPCVTAGMDEVVVSAVLAEGSVPQHAFVIVESTVNAAWRSSCEVGCIASLEFCTGERRRLCSAYFTFVSTQKQPFPTLVVDAGDVDQARRFSEAQERRRIRLARKGMLEQFVVAQPAVRSRALSALQAVKSAGASGESRGHAELLQLVLPGHCNHHGNLFGGWTLEWSVQTALLAATRHARASCVLLQSDDIMFVRPIYVGDRVLCNARVNRVFVEQNTMEVGVRLVRRSLAGQEEHALSAYFLIAPAVRAEGPLSQVTRETEDEKRRYGKAKARMALRLERQGLKTQSLDFCPTLDSANEVSVSSIVLANVAGLLRAFDTSRFAASSWETVHSEVGLFSFPLIAVFDPAFQSGILVKVNHGCGMSPLIFVSFELTMQVSAARALEYVRDPELRKTWDGSLAGLKVLETLGPSDDVVLFQARHRQGLIEFPLLRSWRSNVQNVAGRLLLSSVSVQHSSCPSSPSGARRGFIGGSSGFLIDPTGEQSCSMRYLLQVTSSGFSLVMPDVGGEKGVLFQSALRLSGLK